MDEYDFEYSIFQKDIIEQLENRDWFIACVASNYAFLAAQWGCKVTISERRLGEAYDFWREDQNRTLKEGMQRSPNDDGVKQPSLHYFKHASFISFWLRRMLPINHTNPAEVLHSFKAKMSVPEAQQFFMRYGNELCALLIGFQLCLFFEASFKKDDTGRVVAINKSRLEYLRSCSFPPETIPDFVMILKHKNMSPHALYLLFKALFTNIVPR